MITKFHTSDFDEQTSIEFQKTADNLIFIEISDNSYLSNDSLSVTIDKNNLFSLIGQLLRLQSEIKEGGQNVI